MANIGAYVRSKLDEFRNNIQRSVNDNKGFVQQGHLTAQPIQQAVNNVVNRPFENIGQRLQQVNQTIPQGNPFIRGLQAFPQATKITGQELGKFNPAIKYASNQVIDNVLEGGRNYLTAGNNKLQAGLGALQVGGGVFNATPYGAQFNAAVGGLTAAAKAQREKRQLKLNDVVGSITKPVSPFGEGLGVKDPMLATAGDLGLYAVMGKVGKGNTGKEIMAAEDAVKGLKGKTPPLSPIEDVGGVLKLKGEQGSGVGERSNQLEGLADEARKYKSADEFWDWFVFKKKDPVVDGKSVGKDFAELNPLVSNRKTSDFLGFGEYKFNEGVLKGKIGAGEKLTDGKVNHWKERISKGERPVIIVEDKPYVSKITDHLQGGREYDAILEARVRQGHSRLEAYKQLGIKEVPVVYKSQLTDLYNQATAPQVGKTDPLIAEARKYKSAEEFVKAQGKKTGIEVRDKTGIKLQDPYTAEYLPINPDGTITVYHSTTKEGAGKIKQSGIFGSKTEGGDIYFTTNKKGYGGIGKDKDVVLAFNVEPKKVKFDDIYRGELHLKGNNSDIGGIKPVEIKTKSQLTDIWNKANLKTKPSTKPFVEQKPIKTKTSKVDETLLVEARKYKSAEEFLQAKADEGRQLSNTLEPFDKKTPEQADLVNLHYGVNLYDNLPEQQAVIKKYTDLYNKAVGVKQLKVKPTRLEQIAIDETKPIDEKLGVKTPPPTTPKLQSVEPKIKQPSLEANTSQLPTIQTQKVKQVSQTIQPQGSGVGGQVPIEQKGSPDNLISKIKEKASKLYTEALDRFNPIIKLGRQAGEETKIKRALTGHYGAGSTATYHIDFELTPILKENNIDEVRRVAIAQRDVELAGRNIKGSNTGLKLDELKKELGDEKFNAIQGTLKKLYSYQDTMVKKYLVDTGVISKEGYAAMKSNNQSYIPFKRVMDTVDEYLGVTPPARGAGSVSTQGVIKKIKGSERAIVDPIESIIENTYKTVGLGRRQEVAKTIVGLRSQLPSGTIQEIKGAIGNKPNISLFVNGKVKHYAVPPELADAAKGLSEEGLNTIVKMFASPTRVFRATATGVNPEFALPNVTRDLQSAFVNVGLNPLKWVKGLAHMIKKDEVYQQFLKEGGLTSRISLDRPYLKQTVKGITGKGHVLDVVNPKKLYEFMQVAGQYSEQPTRIAVFEQQYLKGLKKGLSQADAARDAAYWAQEATVNFARRGSKTQSINALYAFLNARAQGTDRLIRSFKANPAQVGLRIGLISQVPAMALYAHNRNFDSYNDKRVVTQTDKDNNFIFMLSDTPIDLPFPGMKGIQYIKIPKGDIGKLANPTEQFMSYADGKGGDTKAALVSSLKAFSPIDNIGGFLPTAFVPPVEVASNHNFFYNSEIVPDYKKGYPAKYQDTSYTSPLYREIGQKTNISPAKIQAIVEGYGTGIAKIGAKLAEPLVGEQYKSDKNKQGAEINKTPILRRFLGGERRTEEEQQLTDIKRSRAIEFDIRDIKGAIKRGDIPQDEGIRQIEKLKQDQIQPSGAKGNSDVLAQFYGYGEHLKSPPSSGLAKYDWEDKKLSEAIKLFNDKDVDGGWRDQYIKKYGYDTNDLRYEAYSRLNETVRSGYLKDELSKQDSQQRIETLKSLRTESISGKVVATDKVLKELNDEGLISDADYKALKAVKYGKDGKLITKSLKGKKPKKLSVAKVGGRKAGRISVKKAKKVSLKALKLKPIKLVARRSKPKA